MSITKPTRMATKKELEDLKRQAERVKMEREKEAKCTFYYKNAKKK